MKKLGKLSINPEKIIKNEELVNLRGGYGGYSHYLSCKQPSGSSCGTTVSSCDDVTYLKSQCDYGCPGWNSYICV